MENKISHIKERIIYLLEYKGIAKEEFYTKIGMTSASFRGNAKKTPLNSNAIENILAVIPDLNSNWLLTGKGEMLLSESDSSVIRTKDAQECPNCESLEKEVAHLKELLAAKDEIINLLKDVGGAGKGKHVC
jgi:hypothetical protein